MPTHTPSITVAIVGNLPSPEGVAARFMRLAKRMGWLDEFIDGGEGAAPEQANGQEAHGERQPSPVAGNMACSEEM
jgi:hypothetical protein